MLTYGMRNDVRDFWHPSLKIFFNTYKVYIQLKCFLNRNIKDYQISRWATIVKEAFSNRAENRGFAFGILKKGN